MLAAGTVLGGDFVVVRLLGSGGMGAVYVVEQTSTGKLRALKVMHRDIAPNEEMQRRFEQEARVGAKIRSGHVVEVVAAGVDEATSLPFLVMELLDGVDLRTHVKRTGPLPAVEVRRIFEQLCHGVGAAHTAGVVHRDLKPENIFLARPNQAGSVSSVVKVLDFGIAKLASEAGTQATAAVGSPLWMAPEQTAPGPVTPAADVWALGLIAYELLTGTHFWRTASLPTATPMHLLREIVLEPIPAASERGGARLPDGFDAWFARCVVRDPKARFADAGELWGAMRDLLPPGTYVVSSSSRPSEGSEALAATAPLDDAIVTDEAIRTPSKTPMAVVAATDPAPEHPSTTQTAVRGQSSRAVLGVAATIAVAGLLGGVAVARRPSESSVVPVPASSRSASAEDFDDPDDEARVTRDGLPATPYMATVQGHHVRLFTHLVNNASNVSDDVVRKAVEWSAWQYQRCYESTYRSSKELPGGTVTVGFDILDQLPRHAAREGSTFDSTVMDTCVVRTLSGQTINAAGPKGAGHVTYAFKFVVM